jgi:type IV pilus assembly protein PilV
MLVDDFVSRVQANRTLANDPVCYAITSDTTAGTPYLGTGNSTSFDCTTTLAGTVQARARATADLLALEAARLGAGETLGASNVGALLDARGCVSQTGNAADGYTLTVTVAWQGRVETGAPPASAGCGKNLYGNEALRRVATTTYFVPNLGAP